VAPTSQLTLVNQSFLHALNKNTPAALAAVTAEVAARAGTFELACWSLAALHAMLDARDEALAWLERAVRRGFINWGRAVLALARRREARMGDVGPVAKCGSGNAERGLAVGFSTGYAPRRLG
jgi:hypothetical protein